MPQKLADHEFSTRSSKHQRKKSEENLLNGNPTPKTTLQMAPFRPIKRHVIFLPLSTKYAQNGLATQWQFLKKLLIPQETMSQLSPSNW